MEAFHQETEVVSTAFLLSNLHCSSCISNIENALSSLQPRPESISPSIVTSWLTVRHGQDLSPKKIQEVLEDAGFEICSINENGVTRDVASSQSPSRRLIYNPLIEYFDQANERPKGQQSITASKAQINLRHLQDCDLCRAEVNQPLEKVSLYDSVSTEKAEKLLYCAVSNDVKRLSSRQISIEGGVPLSGITIDTPTQKSQDTWEASLAISGMTCASCAKSITDELERLDSVKNVHVNLIANTATVQFVDKKISDNLVEAIEDIGFEATLINVVNTKAPTTSTRTVEFRVDGMFCNHCPSQILQSLSSFGDTLHIDKTLSLGDPILKVSYTPRVPELSIRSIMATLSAVDERFGVSIYHPPTLEERSRALHAAEQRRILARVALTVITAIPTFIIGIVFMSLVPSTNTTRIYLEQPWTAGVSRAQWALFIMASPIYFFAADVFHTRALKEVYHLWRKGSKTPILRRLYRFGSMNLLMSLGTSIAYISSVAQLIVAGVRGSPSGDKSNFYFDSVVFLTMFLLIGRLIEAYSKLKTGDTVTMLGKIRPRDALLMEKDGLVYKNGPTISVDLLEVGDIVRVFNGASPPCDGIIVEGQTKFDESSITGEMKPVKKVPNEEVFAGTVNKGTPVSIRMTGVAGNSLMDQIVKTVREGQTRRAPIEGIADALTGYFVPFITLVAICTWIIWLILGCSGALPHSYLGSSSEGWVPWSLQFAIAVFIVACPCGLALAAPTALFVGGGLAAQHGILVKGGGDALEKSSRLDCIVFDKTGTLTHGGQPMVTDHVVLSIGENTSSTLKEDMVLGVLKTLEENSSHTIAKAIVSFCGARDVQNHPVDQVEEVPGKGIKARFDAEGTGTSILIGNEPWLKDHDLVLPGMICEKLDQWKSQGKSVALVAVQHAQSSWQPSMIFAISDPIRPEAPSVISRLQKCGIQVWMISGDNHATATAIGLEVGIPASNIIAGVLPNEKADNIRHLQKSLSARNGHGNEFVHKRALVAMVGDGINDSPALTTADVGIAIGSGSDIAISSAEFVLLSSNLDTLITLLDLSKVVFNRIKFNFGWAVVYNLIGVPVAAGVLYPIVSHGTHIRLDPVWASLAMALSSISVVCSSLALRSNIPVLGFRKTKLGLWTRKR